MIAPGTIVQTPEGRKGVVVPDVYGLSDPGDIQVAWEDEGLAGGSYYPHESELTVLGHDQARVSAACGDCKFIGARGDGLHCLRFSSFRTMIMSRKDMRATREPKRMFPDCQTEAIAQ